MTITYALELSLSISLPAETTPNPAGGRWGLFSARRERVTDRTEQRDVEMPMRVLPRVTGTFPA